MTSPPGASRGAKRGGGRGKRAGSGGASRGGRAGVATGGEVIFMPSLHVLLVILHKKKTRGGMEMALPAMARREPGDRRPRAPGEHGGGGLPDYCCSP